MSEYSTLALLAAFVFAYGAITNRLAKTVVSGAIVFTGFGVLCGPMGLNILRLGVDAESLRTLAELTLALVLFTDAANADLRVLKLSIGLPERLLLVGLPLTIALGLAAGALLFDGLTILELGVLATMLAPTDAALGKAVVTNEAVPPKIRESLNVESGLNDGICVPVLFIFLALATHNTGDGGTTALALRLVLEEIGIGALVGLVLALLAAGALRCCARRNWVAETWLPVPIIALAVTCFATAQSLGGSGFIASFVGGLTFGGLTKQHKGRLLEAAEGTGGVFSLLTWVVFGVAVVGSSIEHFTWRIVLYAVLSLTIVRIVPVLLSLIGTGLRMESKLFIGWFGPRGLASVVFIIIVLGKHLPGRETLAMTVVCTVLLSILAHGLTAMPLAAVYGARAQRSGV
ncbi:MAG: cation:proton antiporter [Phycisphaerae bacterium]|nr:cation:proton antiporter [Phycisphaerae bacterium]